MSTSAGGYVEPMACSDLIDLRVVCMNGEGLTLKLSHATLGREVHRMVSKHFAVKIGGKLALHHKKPLILQQTLQEQGIVGKAATLSCTSVPTNLNAASCYLRGIPVSDGEHAMEGVTKIEGVTAAILQNLNNPPTSLVSLTFGNGFNQSLQGVTLPGSLQELDIWREVRPELAGSDTAKQSLELSVGMMFIQTL